MTSPLFFNELFDLVVQNSPFAPVLYKLYKLKYEKRLTFPRKASCPGKDDVSWLGSKNRKAATVGSSPGGDCTRAGYEDNQKMGVSRLSDKILDIK